MNVSLNSIRPAGSNGAFKPKIVVIGVGGAGGNAINNMIRSNLTNVTFYAVNTDAQALEGSLAENKIQIGANITQGLGAGAKPEIGEKAAQENEAEITEIIKDANMVFIAAGMGGGTGTGAAPIIAKISQSLDILTVAIVTKPFDFEGRNRRLIAESGISAIEKYVDTLIVVPNQNLFRVSNENTSFMDAFQMADTVLCNGAKAVTDLITKPGLVNLDFADLKTIMKNMGKAMISSALVSGEDRAVSAAHQAIINPLLDTSSINGAKGVIISISGGSDMTLFEINDAVAAVKENLGEDANIIFGATLNEDNDGKFGVSVIATGIGDDVLHTREVPKKQSVAENKRVATNIKTESINTSAAMFKKAPTAPSSQFNYVANDDLEDEYDDEEDYEDEDEQEYVNEMRSDVTNDFEEEIEDEDADDYELGDVQEFGNYRSNQLISESKGIKTPVRKLAKDEIETKSPKRSTNSSSSSKKQGISGMLNTLFFGSEEEAENAKQKSKKKKLEIVDLFEDDDNEDDGR